MSQAIKFKNKNNENVYPCPYFPIGSIYMNITNINPEIIFGGRWEKIKGKFLLGTDDLKFKLGKTGGEENHKLLPNEMPSHTHSFTTTNSGYHEHQVALNGDSNFDIYYRLGWGNNHTGYCISGTNINGGTSTYPSYPSIAKGTGTHNHSGTTNSSGNNDYHNNMPPYLVINIWKRVE